MRQLPALCLGYNFHLNLGLPLMTFKMSNDSYMRFMSNFSDTLCDDLNKTSDFWTKLSPAIKFKGFFSCMKLLLLIIFIKILMIS